MNSSFSRKELDADRRSRRCDEASAPLTRTIAIGVAALFGCASSSPKETSEPSNIGRASEQVAVRFAARDEFPDKRPASDDWSPAQGCVKSGPPASAYYRPVVTFAREHMIGRAPGPVHESLVGPNAPPPKLRDGTNIVVDPRGALGELRIVAVGPPFYAPGEKWAETLYCLHVIHQGATTTLAVEEQWIDMR